MSKPKRRTGEEIRQQKLHERDILLRTRKLRARLSVRPNELVTLVDFVELVYDQGFFLEAASNMERLIRLSSSEETTINIPQLYVRLSKCYFRAWREGKDTSHLKASLEAYKKAILDHDVSRKVVSYFELATIYYRLGEYQRALDTFGAAMVVFKGEKDDSETNWLYIGQYSIAHIMFLVGNVREAKQVYDELMLTPLHLKADPGGDNIIMIPLKFTNVGISLEQALILKRTGQKRLALELLQETWNRMDKFHKNFEDHSHERKTAKVLTDIDDDAAGPHQWNAAATSSTQGDLIDLRFGLDQFIDFRFGAKSFNDWIVDARVIKKMGDFLRSQHNTVFAAEWYGFAAELMGHYDDLEPTDRVFLMDTVLLRGECLAELGSWEDAEDCAHFAFNNRPNDISVVSRAARCSRLKLKKNMHLFTQVLKVRYLISLITKNIRRKTNYRRQMREKRLYKAATAISSFFRMVLTRNRLAGDLAGHIAIIISTKRARRLIRLNQLLKTGFTDITQWLKIWNACATICQHAFQNWYRKRKFSVFQRGLSGLKRLALGMLVRSKLRIQVKNIQAELDSNPSAEVRKMLQFDLDEVFDNSNVSGRFGDVCFYLRLDKIKKISSGARTLSSATADDDVYGNRFGETLFGDKTFTKSSWYESHEAELEHEEDPFSPRDVGHPILTEESFFSPLKFKQRIFRRTASQVKGGEGITWFTDTVPGVVTINVNGKLNTRVDTAESKDIPADSMSSLGSISKATYSKKDMRYEAPQYNPTQNISSGDSLLNKKALSIDQIPQSPPRLGSNLDQPSWVSALPSIDMPLNQLDLSEGFPESSIISHHAKKVNRMKSFVPRTVLELEEYLSRTEGEEVHSLIGRSCVSGDEFVQWVPFSILPDSSIARLLCCSQLSIVSPSFGLLESIRLCHVVKLSNNRLWANVRSLMIFGTRMKDVGIFKLLNLQNPALSNVAFSGTNCTYRIAYFFGSNLRGYGLSQELIESSVGGMSRFSLGAFEKGMIPQLSTLFRNLVKLSFEDEIFVGDRGACDLFKNLQFNATLKYISFIRCGLTDRSAIQASRWIGITQAGRTLNLNGNKITKAGCIKIIQAVANVAHKGCFKDVYLCNQMPDFPLKAFQEMKNFGVNLGLIMDVPNVTAAMESVESIKRQLEMQDECLKVISDTFDQTAKHHFDKVPSTAFLKTVHL